MRPTGIVSRIVSCGPMLVVALLALVGPARSAAQGSGGNSCVEPVSDPTTSHESWSFSVWFAGGTHQPIKTVQGHKEDRALYLAGIQGAIAMYRAPHADVDFTPTLIPGILTTANREYRTVSDPAGSPRLVLYKKNAFGAGLLPVAMEARLFVSQGFGLVVGGGGGVSYFDRRIPDPDETRFNFLANGHTGLYLRNSIGTTTVGFWLQHISNGNMGKVNPGMDSRLLYVSFAR